MTDHNAGSGVAVDGFAVPEAAILAEMQYHPATDAGAAREAAARAIVVRQLLRRAAGLPPTLEPDAEGDAEAIAAHLQTALSLPQADEATCRRYYEQNRRRFRTPDLIEARHILLAAAPDDEEARAAARERGRALVEQLLQRPERFAELAVEHSDCPSKSAGGHLGQLTRGSAVPEFETYLFSLEPGELCRLPVESRYGVHVVQCLARDAGRELPYDAVSERVAAYLEEASWRRAFTQYVSLLAGQSEIAGLSFPRWTAPLVQ